MKTQDFMEALGGVSQEKLDALAKWQNAKTPITGEAPAKENCITQTADKPVFAARRRGTMKQNMKKKAFVAQINPWKISVGAAVAACVVIAVSVGVRIISMDKQMQVGMSGETSVAEQISLQEPNTNAESREPVKLIDRLKIFGGAEQVMMPVPKEGTVQVLHSMADTETVIRCSDEEVGYKAIRFEEFLNDDVFAQYDVLYYAFKDEQIPLYAYDYDLAGGCIAEDGKTLKLNCHALMFDPEHLPLHFCDSTEPFWNTYCFYAVPKGSLPELETLEISFDQYPIGDIPDDILQNWDELIYFDEPEPYGDHTTKLKQYLETKQEYLDWVMSMPKPKYITWADSTSIPPDECVEYQATADEKRVEIAGTTEFGSPVGIPDEACFLVRSEEDYQAMTALYPNIDCGFAESDEYDALFLLIPIEDADTYVSVTGITVSEATGRISLFIADDSSAYRDLETFSATKIVRLYIEKDALLPEFSGEFPQKVGMNVTWDYENTYDDFSAFCEAYPAATYIEVVS